MKDYAPRARRITEEIKIEIHIHQSRDIVCRKTKYN